MSDYTKIYLQPECCAGEEGRLWCQDDEPETCPDGVKWTPYILLSEYATAQDEIEALREENEQVRQANLHTMDVFEDMKAAKEKAEARVAELSNLCERLQHCAQGFYVDQGDYGHMEAIMKDYHWIMRASKPWRDAYIKRVQAEAVEAAKHEHALTARIPDGTAGEHFQDGFDAAAEQYDASLDRYAQRLRQQADEAERAGGAS